MYKAGVRNRESGSKHWLRHDYVYGDFNWAFVNDIGWDRCQIAHFTCVHEAAYMVEHIYKAGLESGRPFDVIVEEA